MEKDKEKSYDTANNNGSIERRLAMENVQYHTNLLVEAIKDSKEYKNYHQLLKKVMQEPALYDRINKLRRDSFALQFSNKVSLFEESERLYSENEQVLENQLVREFLSAEQVYCSLIKDVKDTILDYAGIDIDFLEE